VVITSSNVHNHGGWLWPWKFLRTLHGDSKKARERRGHLGQVS